MSSPRLIVVSALGLLLWSCSSPLEQCTDHDQCGPCRRCQNGACTDDPEQRDAEAELCGDGKDNDCDSAIDESDCVAGCLDEACVTPPAPGCISSTTLRTWGGHGRCEEAGCRYSFTDRVCDHGCDATAGACSECSDECPSLGVTECEDGQVRTCGRDPSGCLSWSGATACPSGFCLDAAQCGACRNECSKAGATECSDAMSRVCMADERGCLAWTGYTACASGACGDPFVCCTDECSPGTTACENNQFRSCTHRSSGCHMWSAPLSCDPLTACTSTADGASCGPCPDGYRGTGLGGCTDIDECLAENGGCDPLSSCTNVPGSRTCSACPDGYSGTGETSCLDVDECLVDNGGCGLRVCTNVPGTWRCGGDSEWAQWPVPPDGPTNYTVTDETVVDNVTGLVWQRVVPAQDYVWTDAQTYCSGWILAGTSGGRLPTRSELISIVDETRVSSAINRTAFPDTFSGCFWTATPSAGSSSSAWVVYFWGGDANTRQTKDACSVRCVR